MKRQIAKTAALEAVDAAYLFLKDQQGEKLGAIWGEPGSGKTTAAKFLAQKYQAVYLSAIDGWTPFQLANSILRAITGERARSLTVALDSVILELQKSEKALFIDEAERVLSRRDLINCLRTIHDHAEVPVLLIGMTGLYPQLTQYPVLADRCQYFLTVPDCTFDDARLLADTRCDVKLADDLLYALLNHRDIGRNLRRIKRAIAHIEQLALDIDSDVVTVADWGDRSFLPEFSLPPASRVVAMRG